jgi:hypothetical protein
MRCGGSAGRSLGRASKGAVATIVGAGGSSRTCGCGWQLSRSDARVSTFVKDVLYETRVFAMHAQSLAEGAIFTLRHCYEWHAHRMDSAK